LEHAHVFRQLARHGADRARTREAHTFHFGKSADFFNFLQGKKRRPSFFCGSPEKRKKNINGDKKKMAVYMQPVNAILQQVNTAPAVEQTTPVWWYVFGVGAASFVALKLLSPSCVMSENADGISEFSASKAAMFAGVSMAIAYYLLSKLSS
jgi:hypothetical protein